jgi:site-specific recombinase XerD
MATTLPSVPTIVTTGDLADELASFVRHLRAGNVSPNTVYAYAGAVVSLGRFLKDHGYPTDVRAIERQHVEEWINDLLGRYKATTAHQRYRGAQRFFHWYASIDDGETFRSPMAKMRPPRLPEYLPEVLTIEQLRALLAACTGRTFEDRRDEALLRIFFDTGARRAEVASLRWSTDPTERDIDLATGQVRLFGKGRRERYAYLSPTTIEAVERYIRARKPHTYSADPALWLGRKGRLTDSGIAQTIRDLGARAGIAGLHPHVLRHSWRHHAASAGMSREDMMQLGGWRSDAMLRRYASSTANARALDSARTIALGDKL